MNEPLKAGSQKNTKRFLLVSVTAVAFALVGYFGWKQHKSAEQGTSSAQNDLNHPSSQQTSEQNTASMQGGEGNAPQGILNSKTNLSPSVVMPNEAVPTQNGMKNTNGMAQSGAVTPQEELKKQEAQQELTTARSASCAQVVFQSNSPSKNGAQLYARNKIKLPEEALHAGTYCVRVDGVPVKHAFASPKKDEIVFGSVAKANSVVSVRYCRAGIVCNENCTVPKDEFMDALAGEDDLNQKDQKVEVAARWDSKSKGASVEEAAVDRELEAMEDALEDRKPGVFSAWLVARQTPACEGKTQQKSVPERRTASAK